MKLQIPEAPKKCNTSPAESVAPTRIHPEITTPPTPPEPPLAPSPPKKSGRPAVPADPEMQAAIEAWKPENSLSAFIMTERVERWKRRQDANARPKTAAKQRKNASVIAPPAGKPVTQ